MTSGAGTYHWMAPEVLSGQSYDEKVGILLHFAWESQVDVYSYGICLFELITRRIPYDTSGGCVLILHWFFLLFQYYFRFGAGFHRGGGESGKAARWQAGAWGISVLCRRECRQDCPADLNFTMKCCWAHRPTARPGFDTILAPWNCLDEWLGSTRKLWNWWRGQGASFSESACVKFLNDRIQLNCFNNICSTSYLAVARNQILSSSYWSTSWILSHLNDRRWLLLVLRLTFWRSVKVLSIVTLNRWKSALRG